MYGPSNPRRKKKCFLATIRALQKEVGASYFGAEIVVRVCSITVTAVLLEHRRASGTCRFVPVPAYRYSCTGPVPRTG